MQHKVDCLALWLLVLVVGAPVASRIEQFINARDSEY